MERIIFQLAQRTGFSTNNYEFSEYWRLKGAISKGKLLKNCITKTMFPSFYTSRALQS